MNLFWIRKKELKIMYNTLLDELISLENEYIEKTNQVRKLDKRIKTISELQYYNKQPEVILSYLEYDNKSLVVTADLMIDKNGQLNKMRFALCKLLEFNPPLELSSKWRSLILNPNFLYTRFLISKAPSTGEGKRYAIPVKSR